MIKSVSQKYSVNLNMHVLCTWHLLIQGRSQKKIFTEPCYEHELKEKHVKIVY